MPEHIISTIQPDLLAYQRLAFDQNGFVDWLVEAAPGDICAYYRGSLAYDRDAEKSKLGQKKRRQLAQLADQLMHSSDLGLVYLLQRRLGIDDSLYLAVRSSADLTQRRFGRSQTMPHHHAAAEAV